mgnify:CR=1 FL=1
MKKIAKLINSVLKFFGLAISKIDSAQPIEEITKYEQALLDSVSQYTMTTTLRKWALIQSVKYVLANKIPGDFVESGVWRGGNLMIMKSLLKKNKCLTKKIYAFDTFEGMPQPHKKFDFKYDGTDANILYNRKKEWCYASIEDVSKNIQFDKNIKLIKGKVEQTLLLKKNIPKKIALLRLDTDFYNSTKIELEELFPRLSKGGILIIDDYGAYTGCKKAVDNYFKKKFIFLHHVDHSCRLFIKP